MGVLCSVRRMLEKLSGIGYCDEGNVSIHKVLPTCLVRDNSFHIIKHDYVPRMDLFLGLSLIDIPHQIYEPLHYICLHHSHELMGGYKDAVSPFSFLLSFCSNARSKLQARSVSEDLIYT